MIIVLINYNALNFSYNFNFNNTLILNIYDSYFIFLWINHNISLLLFFSLLFDCLEKPRGYQLKELLLKYLGKQSQHSISWIKWIIKALFFNIFSFIINFLFSATFSFIFNIWFLTINNILLFNFYFKFIFHLLFWMTFSLILWTQF